jgi:HK97 family phage major capsid protein
LLLRSPDYGGGGALGDAEFKQAVLDGVEALQERQQEHLSDYTRFSKETKAALADLTKLKQTANDHHVALRAIQTAQAALQRERRQAFGDPVQRILNDEHLCLKFTAAVRRALLKPGERLPDKYAKALGEDTSPGSTLVDDELAREIYDTLGTFGVWNTFALRRLSTKQTKFPVSTARVKAQFILTEGGTIADDSTKAGTSVTAEAHVIAALLNVTMQLIEDAEADLASELLVEFAEAYAERLDHACLNADGTADGDNGGMTGIFRGGTAATAAAGNVTTETTDFEDWLRCLTTVDPVVLRRMAKWWIHPQILARALAVKDGNGRPLFLTAIEAPSFGAIGTILGYPVVPAFAAPSANAAGAKIAVFGDPNGLVCGVRRDFVFESSDHHKWNTLHRSFRGWGRAAAKIRRAEAFAVLTLPAA